MDMRRTLRIGTWLAGAAIALALAPAANAEETGGVCMEDPATVINRANTIDAIQDQLASQSPDDAIALNTRGYRYEPDKRPMIARDLQLLEIEIRRSRDAAKREGRLP
jgi:hypothetical protein